MGSDGLPPTVATSHHGAEAEHGGEAEEEEGDTSGLFALADVAKQFQNMTEIALSDEDLESEAARHIEQSLSVNRALKVGEE